MSRCIRCASAPGTVLVHVISGGNMLGENGGPKTARVYACAKDAADIFKQYGTPPWMARQSNA